MTRRARDWGIITAVTILCLAVAYLFWDRQTRVQQVNALSSALDRQRQQAVQSGQTPVVPPPKQILATPTPITGPRGDTGATGATGPAGRGLTSVVCVGGKWRVEYTDGAVDADAGACTGPPGPIGRTGASGQSIVGSTGPQGEPGKDGKDGQDGQSIVGPTGPAGPAGKDGAAGQPPAEWDWAAPDGTNYRCTRNADSPDSAPAYACSPVTASPSD